MKNRLLLLSSLLATVLVTARCSENAAGLDAGAAGLDAATVEPPDAAQVEPPDAAAPLCDPAKCAEGNICVQDRCMLACARHTECPDESYDCRDVAGHLVCVPNGMPIGTGEFGYPCGSEMVNCAAGFRCLGGKGDPSSYCSRTGCTGDDDCPGNYSCVNRDVAVGDAGVDAAYLTITVCQRRGFCAAATGLVDCNNANAIFEKDFAGRGWCLKGCSGLDVNGCGAGNECVSTDAGYECWPRARTCAPTEKFCGRCTTSSDCGPDGYCYVDSYTKEPMCLTPCSTETDCNSGALPTGRVLGQCGAIWDGYCTPEQTGFSQNPDSLSCWYAICNPGFAGCTDADYVDLTAATADRTVSGSYTEWDAGYAGEYTPKCIKIKIGQSVVFTGTYSFDDLPLTQACGPIYNIGSLESGGATTVRFNKAGLHGYFEPYLDDGTGTKMAGSILVVP